MLAEIMTAMRFPIRYNPAARFLLGAIFIRPAGSFVEVTEREVSVHMGWGFRARFARSSVARCSNGVEGILLGLGIHGFGGRWLVNGSLDGLVSLQLSPAQRAYVLGVPVKLRELQVSLTEPEALLTLLQAAPA
jgi:hypothetical protein